MKKAELTDIKNVAAFMAEQFLEKEELQTMFAGIEPVKAKKIAVELIYFELMYIIRHGDIYVYNRQPCSSRISAPSLRSASKCRSMGLGPSSHPPGNDNLASPQRDRIAPKNTMDERISRMRLWGISQRVMPSAQTVKVSPVWVQRHPSRRKMVTAVCTSDSAGQLCSTVSPSQRSAAASSGSVLFYHCSGLFRVTIPNDF